MKVFESASAPVSFIAFIATIGMVGCKTEQNVPRSLLLEKPPVQVNLGTRLILKPSAGHHFNLEAPNSCGEGTLKKRTEGEIVCEMEKAGTQTVTVSLCDDARTFCKVEKHSIDVK